MDVNNKKIYENIICPFCFNEPNDGDGNPFSHEEVCFRISDASIKDDNSGTTDTSLSESVQMMLNNSKDKKSDTIKKNEYRKIRDNIYIDFWTGLNPDITQLLNPVIEPEKYNTDQYKKKYAKSGMLEAIIDEYGNRTTDRLCPYCHNSLPKNYGQFVTKFISVVGVTGCGKTVFISQLLKKFAELLANSCGIDATLSTYAEQFYRKQYPISSGKKLPESSQRNILKKDLITIDLAGAMLKNKVTLVLYDIAGENCVYPDRMEKFGPFICHANAILMLLDPYQFDSLTGDLPTRKRKSNDDEEMLAPNKVINIMYELFLKSKYGNEKADIPIALTFAQSDLLYNGDLFNRQSNIFHKIEYKTKGFQKNQHYNLSKDLERKVFIGSHKDVLLSAKSKFIFADCFAISSLGIDTKINESGILISRDSIPHRIEEPLLWVLNKFGYIREIQSSGIKSNKKKKGLFK